MPYPDHTPYDILGVPPSASLPVIMQAYQQAMRARRFPPPKITQAFNDLRNTRRRAEHDLLMVTHLGQRDEAIASVAALRDEDLVAEQIGILSLRPGLSLLGRTFQKPEHSRPIPGSPFSPALPTELEQPNQVLPNHGFPT